MELRAEFVGFRTLFEKEIRRYLKVITQTVLAPIINSALYLLVFGVSIASLLKMEGGYTYLEFLIPGLMAMSSLNNALQNSSSSVIISKFHGDLQDLRVMPLSSLAICLAYASASISRGLLVGFLVFCVGQLFHYFQMGSFFEVQQPGLLLLIGILGCFVFGNLGIWVGFISSTFDQINGFNNFIILPLIWLGGVFYSIDVLHPFWKSVSELNPLFYIINGIRYATIGVSDVSVSTSLSIVGSFAFVSCFLAYYSVKKGSYQRF